MGGLFDKAVFRLVGDRGVIVEYGDEISLEINIKVRTMAMAIAEEKPVGIVEVIPTYRSLLIVYDPLATDLKSLEDALQFMEGRLDQLEIPRPRTVEIPVSYGGDLGPDIEFVAQAHNLTVEDVIRIHSGALYQIYMIGFTPGFPFLGGLPPELHTPRLETPRPLVPAGSVGIANNQTGVYPIDSPGGWRLIGRTPAEPVQPVERKSVSLPCRGHDQVRADLRGGIPSHPIGRERLMEVFKVLEPGPFTTIQDSGRYGYQQFGIPVSGALDTFSYLAANVLVGNPDNAAGLEITFMGPRLEALSDALVAVTGAEVPLFVNDQPQAMWTSFRVRRGDVINMKASPRGVRAYLAVAGGLLVPQVMGSRSTYTGGKIGGLDGRPLARGDRLHGGSPVSLNRVVSLPEDLRPKFSTEVTLRVLPGPQDDYFDTGLKVFFNSVFTVTSKADRMGYRLDGPIIEPKDGVPLSIISEPSLSGAVQIPTDGQPIILLVEQTASGYAKIATIITADLDVVAQARPGDKVRFARVDLTAGPPTSPRLSFEAQ